MHGRDDDARYHEHHYGKFSGRDAIETWITGVMQPFPEMDFPVEWRVIDGNRVVMLCQNRLPDPTGGDTVYQFPTLVVLHYDHDFDLIASVTGQPEEWVVPAGSAD